MSNVFGTPPPPETPVWEPGSAGALRARRERAAEAWANLPPDPDRWSRRAAVALAVLAVALLVVANFAAWMNFTVIDPSRATGLVVDRSVGEVGTLVEQLAPEVTAAVIAQAATAGVTPPDPAIARADVEQALTVAAASPQLREAWLVAVRTAADEQRDLARGNGVPRPDQVVVTVPLDAVNPAVTRALVDRGYTYVAGAQLVTEGISIATEDSAANHRTAVRIATLWWVFALGAILLAAAALRLARRPLRFGAILAVDAAVMLAGCLLLVPAFRQIVDDQALDPDHAPILLAAFDALTAPLVRQTLVLVVVALSAAVVLGLAERRRRARAAEAYWAAT